MMLYNPMTCENLPMNILGPCSMAWFSFAIIVFLGLILRRQCEDGILSGTGFNFIAAMALGIISNIALTVLTGEPRWSLLAGLIGLAVGGFGFGLILDTTGGAEA